MLKQIDPGLVIVLVISIYTFILPEYMLSYLSTSVNHFKSSRGDKAYNISIEFYDDKIIVSDSQKKIEEIAEIDLEKQIKDFKGTFSESIRAKIAGRKNFNIRIENMKKVFIYSHSGYYDEFYASEENIEPSSFINLIYNINKHVNVSNKDDEDELYSLLYVAVNRYLSEHILLFYRYNIIIINPGGTSSIFNIDYSKYGTLDYRGFGSRLLLEMLIKENNIYVLQKEFKIESTIYYSDNPFINSINMYLEKDRNRRIIDCVEGNEYHNIKKNFQLEDFKKNEHVNQLISFLTEYLNNNMIIHP